MAWYELSLLACLGFGGLVGRTLWTQMQTNAFSLLAGFLFYRGANAPHTARIASSPLLGLRKDWEHPLLRKLAPAWIAVTAIVERWLTHIAFQLSGPPVSCQYLVGRYTPQEVAWILLAYALIFATGVTFWGFMMAQKQRLRCEMAQQRRFRPSRK